MTHRIAASILRDAGQLIRENGWARGVSWDPKTGQLDLLGAVSMAAGCPRSLVLESAFPLADAPMARRLAALSAWEALDAALNCDPVEWNDAPGRTSEQVVRLLDGVAAALDSAIG